MSTLTWIGIFILIFLIIVWITHHLYKKNKIPRGPFLETYEYILNNSNKTYDKIFTEPIDLYNRTIGHVNDETVKFAIQKALKKEEMYTKNELEGNLNKNVGKAAENSFILADLYRFHQEDNDRADFLAASYYNKALNRILTNPNKAIENNINPEFMIDRAEHFYDQNKIENNINPNFNNIRNVVRNARKNTLKNKEHNKNKNRNEEVQNILKEKVQNKEIDTVNIILEERKDLFNHQINNDPQNVHDRNINHSHKSIYELFKTNMRGDEKQEIIAELEKELLDSNLTDEKKEDALAILEQIKKGNTSSNLNDTEDNLLANIWRRINHPDNISNKDAMKSALFENLSDSMEKSYGSKHPVCLTGRCSRMLQTLTVLDSDTRIASPVKTTDMIRSEALQKTYHIIQNELKKTNKPIDYDYDEDADFRQHLNNVIKNELAKDYSDVDKKTLETIIADATAF